MFFFWKFSKKNFGKFWIFEKNYSLKPSLAYLLSYWIFSFLKFLAVWEEIGDKKLICTPPHPTPPHPSGIKHMWNKDHGVWHWTWKWMASESRSLTSFATIISYIFNWNGFFSFRYFFINKHIFSFIYYSFHND